LSAFEWIAVGVTLVAVFLTVRQVIWCWPLSMVSVTMYAWVFYDARLYADMGLQGLYFILSAYGWWAWRRKGPEDEGEGVDPGVLEVTLTPGRQRLLLLAIGIAAGLLMGRGLSRFTDAALPFMDSTLTSFSVIAQWMQTRKRLETWLIWLTVDVFYVGMFIYKGLYPTAGLYAVFLCLAAMGFLEWRRHVKTASNPAPA
jgi:nicotinamide mononucleotide transporter